MMKNVFGTIFLLVVCCAAYAEQAAEQPKAASVSAEGVTSINDDMQAAAWPVSRSVW